MSRSGKVPRTGFVAVDLANRDCGAPIRRTPRPSQARGPQGRLPQAPLGADPPRRNRRFGGPAGGGHRHALAPVPPGRSGRQGEARHRGDRRDPAAQRLELREHPQVLAWRRRRGLSNVDPTAGLELDLPERGDPRSSGTKRMLLPISGKRAA